MRNQLSKRTCLIYVPVPHLGWGWVDACVRIAEAFPTDVLSPTIVLPRAFTSIGQPISVKEAIPRSVPYRYVSPIVRPAVNYFFGRALRSADPRNTLSYFWPMPPHSLVDCARRRGVVTVREMLNTFCGTAKSILDEAYDRVGLPPTHGITEERVELERKDLEMYDFILSSNLRIEESLVNAGINPKKILHSSYGWSPDDLATNMSDEPKASFRALFIGTVGVRKGVPQLLEAWKRSGVDGELLIVGPVEECLKPLISRYLHGCRVKFQGFTRDLARLYRSSDLFVFPSLEEGDPQVTYQAAGFGLPVIATPMGSASVIRNEVNGLVVKPYDVDGLAEAISRLAGSQELRHRLGKQAANDARAYTYEIIGRKRANLFSSLLVSRS